MVIIDHIFNPKPVNLEYNIKKGDIIISKDFQDFLQNKGEWGNLKGHMVRTKARPKSKKQKAKSAKGLYEEIRAIGRRKAKSKKSSPTREPKGTPSAYRKSSDGRKTMEKIHKHQMVRSTSADSTREKKRRLDFVPSVHREDERICDNCGLQIYPSALSSNQAPPKNYCPSHGVHGGKRQNKKRRKTKKRRRRKKRTKRYKKKRKTKKRRRRKRKTRRRRR